MKKNNKTLTYMVIIAAVTLMAACTPTNEAEPTEADETITGLANPAAVYCEGLGYTLESVERNGGEDADCVFPDGSSCPQWDFLSGRCGQAYSYCEQQGGALEEGDGNIGVCRFPDGSYCDEYALFSEECAAGENFDETTGYPIEDETAAGYPIEDDSESGYPIEINIQSFEEARDYMAIYFLNEYGIVVSEPWIEADITTDNATASTTKRYVSGPLTIVISSMASAPLVNYTIEEASDLVKGFSWQGTLRSDGTVIVDYVHFPATVLNAEDARDAALAYISENHELTLDYNWADLGQAEKPKDDHATLIRTFAADSWTVEVEFMASAPLTERYIVRVFDEVESFRWEGEITMYGTIIESRSTH